jgi:hypothetical protein
MALNDDEFRYKNVINTLKSIQEVKAPQNFEADLMRRINSEKFKGNQNFWQKILIPSRLVPSAALAVAAIILLFFFNISSEDSENPLLVEPKVREDVIATENISEVPLNEGSPSEKLSDMKKNTVEQRQKLEQSRTATEDSSVAMFRSNSSLKMNDKPQFTVAGYSIDKGGLNFRQVNLSKEEQKQLRELREHFRTLLKHKNN